MEFVIAAGEVRASVAPTGFLLQLHKGNCSAVPSLVTEGISQFTAVVPGGDYHVLVGNPTDSPSDISLLVYYMQPVN